MEAHEILDPLARHRRAAAAAGRARLGLEAAPGAEEELRLSQDALLEALLGWDAAGHPGASAPGARPLVSAALFEARWQAMLSDLSRSAVMQALAGRALGSWPPQLYAEALARMGLRPVIHPGSGQLVGWVDATVRVAAGLLEGPPGRYLVGERIAGKPYAGLLEIPGGKLGAGEAPAAAAERELLEELGLRVRAEERALCSWEGWCPPDSGRPGLRVRVDVHRVYAAGETLGGAGAPPPPGDSHASTRWMTLLELLSADRGTPSTASCCRSLLALGL